MEQLRADQPPAAVPEEMKESTRAGEVGKGYFERDKGVRIEEENGLIEFTKIKNDQTDENMKWLIDLKCVISAQLPKMPKEYIVRLIMDRIHESVIILKKLPSGK